MKILGCWENKPTALNNYLPSSHSLRFSHSVVSDPLPPCGLPHARPPCPSSVPKACSNPCPSRQWCHPTILTSVVPFSSCLQSFPESGSFPMSQFSASGGQRIGASASASVLPMNIQNWFALGLTGLISLQSKGLSSLLQHHSSNALHGCFHKRVFFATVIIFFKV